MNRIRTGGTIIVLSLTMVFLFSCATVTERVENSFASIAFRENRKGETWWELSSPFIPSIVLKGDLEEKADGFLFYVTQVDLFTSWYNGWTEGVIEGSGSFILHRESGGMVFRLKDELSLWDVTSGEVRYYDTYFRGDDGLRKVKNRVDRMMEVGRFFKEEKGFPPFYGDMVEETRYGGGFAPDVVSYLFPESKKLFKRKERRLIFSKENKIFEAAGPEKVLGAGMYWRSDYTEKVLPEHLVDLRNSGTLWRDYEEASLLFYSLYNLEYLFNIMLEGSILTERK